MVQKHVSAKISPRFSLSVNTAPHSNGPEQGLAPAPVPSVQLPSQSPEPHPVFYANILTGPRGSRRPALLKLEWDFSHYPQPPIGPRLLNQLSLPGFLYINQLESISPALRSPSPCTHRQRGIADQTEMLRIQILVFGRVGGKEGVMMDLMSEKTA